MSRLSSPSHAATILLLGAVMTSFPVSAPDLAGTDRAYCPANLHPLAPRAGLGSVHLGAGVNSGLRDGRVPAAREPRPSVAAGDLGHADPSGLRQEARLTRRIVEVHGSRTEPLGRG